MRRLYHRSWIKFHWLMTRFHQGLRIYHFSRRDLHWLAYNRLLDKKK